MRFKIDENMSVEAATILNEAGHDLLTIHDQRMVGEADTEVASVCKLEQRAFGDTRSGLRRYSHLSTE